MKKILASYDNLLKNAKEVLASENQLASLEKLTNSLVIDGKLYWNLGENLGYLVIDPATELVNLVKDLSELLGVGNQLSENTKDLLVMFVVNQKILEFQFMVTWTAVGDSFTGLLNQLSK